MSKFIDFNLYNMIKFKVNEKGLKLWKEAYYDISPIDRFNFENDYQKDECGYYQLPTWEFISIFYKECHHSNNNLGFDMNVKLEIKDKNEVQR